MRQYQDSVLRQVIQSRRVVTPDGITAAAIVHEDGRIVSLEPYGGSVHTVDCGERYILPGMVDTHVHINEPGRTEWEGFRTATRAAAAGGYTCLVDMPLNSIPATTSLSALAQKRVSASGKCLVDYSFWGGAVRGNASQLSALALAGVRGFKCFMAPSGVDEFEMVTEADLDAAMPVIASTGLPLLVHAEFPAVLADASGETWIHYRDYLASRPDMAEVQAIEILIRLCREYQCPIHIVHLATGEALSLLKAARSDGLPVTVETCPHYLCFAAEEIPDRATQYKCAPPIRDASARNHLWQGLREGIIDFIATDHSPCPPALKRFDTGDFAQAWGGIASLSVAVSAVYTEALQRGFDITDVVRWMAERPAALAGFNTRKGRLENGFDADFVVFDPDAEFLVNEELLHFRHPVTPYLGLRLRGRVEQTYLRGQRIYAHGEFAANPSGCECKV
jgi:allantoinase